MNWQQDTYQKALAFAAEAHGNQKIPGGTLPYVAHLANVSMEVIAALHHSSGLDEDRAIACALLHDVVEDTPVTATRIGMKFGPLVSMGVLALTKKEHLPKSEQMADSLRRIMLQGAEIRIVKMADRITNLQPPPDFWSLKKRQAYHHEASLILDTLKGANEYIEQRLAQKIEAYAAYCQTAQ